MIKPNIIMMISHDTGRYLGSYGRHVATPGIDGLAQDGVRFDQYFCSAPQCSPSRGSILTGLYAHNHGMIGLSHLGFSIDEDKTTLPKELSKAGYETVLIGLSHETIGEPGGRSFTSSHALGYERVEHVCDPGNPDGNLAPLVADKTIAFMREKAAAGGDRPFFASVGFFETHRDFDAYEPEADPDESIVVPDYLPDTPNVRRDFAQFQGSVKVLDRAIERIYSELKATGLDKNTLIIYTTDHGIAFPRAKGTLLDAGLETALIMAWPTVIRGARSTSELLCNVDLMPTLLDIAGADIPPDLDGRSFLPLLKEEPYEPRDAFFCELTWHDRYHPMRGMRTERYKYVRNFEDGPAVYLPLDIHRSLAGRSVREDYYVPNVPEELYDLVNDPLEQHNLAYDENYAAQLQELRQRVERWMRETNDPLLQGPVSGAEAPDWQQEVEKGTTYQGRSH
ncbi:sulfatase family protein [Paenibacillus xerothermodurans]|uniref:Sulfatase n=1 Tax=Paenibacillus xerothermodurans TaxID=1977292 RepID=A0A2W1N6M6_PAEXE|nr:sulfatase [Paenibacillus xerothermodurans]PZE20057.1 sulfatase [Paenibacillus xerothermodurans]